MYQNYHRHSHVSNIILTDSECFNKDYAERAVELGHSILSSCEHGTQGNYRECAELAGKYGLKWRYVAEMYFVHDRFTQDKTNAHMILAARTLKGTKDLNEVISEAHISGYYHRPRIDLDLLSRLSPKDVFITTACVGGIWKYGMEEAENIVRRLYEQFKGSFMLEVQPNYAAVQKEVNENILRLYRKYGIPIIAGVDSHYILPEDKVLRDDRLEANHIKYEDEDGFFMDYPSDETLFERFQKQGVLPRNLIAEAMDNTNIFLDFEDITFDKSRKLPTLYPNLTQEERNEKYRTIIREKWLEKRKNIPREEWKKYQDGIAYEVDTITSTNTSDYFLLDYEMVKRGQELGGNLTKTGRGSAPSYYTNSLLGLSSIDRFSLPVTLYPDRFITAERLKVSMPDIDLNVDSQAIFAEAQAELLGEWKSAPMISYKPNKRLSAWKMYCRAANIDYKIANEVSDSLKKYELDVKHADEDEADEINVADYIPAQYIDILRQSEKYLNIIETAAPHPCAFLLCTEDIRREIGVIRLKPKPGSDQPTYCAFIDGATADAFGYLKNDLLQVTVVKMNKMAYEAAGIEQPSAPELIEMTKNDKLTWSMYEKGYTLGLNQAEKEKSTEKVMRYAPKNISELSAYVAGIRPGFASMADTMFSRRRFKYDIPVLDALIPTKEMPDSFILYQEQVMAILQLAGFPASESYAAIKAIAKKHPEKVLPLKDKFLKGFSEKLAEDSSLSEQKIKETADQVWGIVQDNTSYSFNCLSGDTRIMRPWYPRGELYAPTIAEMYKIRNDYKYAVSHDRFSLHCQYHARGYGNGISIGSNGEFKTNGIKDIKRTGWKEVIKITTKGGRSITCTPNHKFPILSPTTYRKASSLKVGDMLFVCKGPKPRGKYDPYELDEIISIEPDGETVVYDVTMDAPTHNFVIDNGIVTANCSHSISVALDSLYGAYMKAHYPYEYYQTYMSICSERKEKEKIAKAKAEMKRRGIETAHCKFRQDNRTYTIDKEHHCINDSLTSVKGVSLSAANVLYQKRNEHYETATDMLLDMELSDGITSSVITTLIELGYFSEFGTTDKLLYLYNAIRSGDGTRVTKSTKSISERRQKLIDMETQYTGNAQSIQSIISAELKYYGLPVSTDPASKFFAVLNIDDKYSPKVTLYNIAKGTTGVMKIRKPYYKKNPIRAGDFIIMQDWVKKQAYGFADGKPVIKEGIFDLWLECYKVENEVKANDIKI